MWLSIRWYLCVEFVGLSLVCLSVCLNIVSLPVACLSASALSQLTYFLVQSWNTLLHTLPFQLTEFHQRDSALQPQGPGTYW